MPETSLPNISVVMTVFNAEKYVRDAIDSVLNQTCRDYEFIIVDNKSSDASRDIIKKFSDSRITYIENEENLGQTKALNIGIRHSRGKYVARMDADDIAFPQRLQRQFDFLEKNSDIALVGSWCQDINQDGKPLRIYKVPTDTFWIQCCFCGSGELTRWCITHPSVMMRRDVLEEVGLYDEQKSFDGYPQDYDLWMRIIRKYHMSNIGEPLLKYRILGASESKSFIDKSVQYCIDITTEKIKYYLPEFNEKEVSSLANMLEYQIQGAYQDGLKVLGLFDQYFYRFMRDWRESSLLEKSKNRIKLYYLPVLFHTNKWLSLKTLLKMIVRYPSLAVDVRFYRKSIKVLLKSLFSKKRYRNFVKRILFYR